MANSPDHRNTVAMSRLRKFRMVFIGLPVALVLFVTVSAYWLLNTASGALWVWGKVEHATAGAIRVSGIEGDLSTGLILKNIEFQQDDLEVQAQRVELTAGPGWLPFSIQIKGFRVQDVEITIRTGIEEQRGESQRIDIQATLAGLEPPIPLEIHNAALSNITLQKGDGSLLGFVETLQFSASLDERLVVDQLHVLAPELELTSDANIALQSPHSLDIGMTGHYEMADEEGKTVLDLPFDLELTGDLDKLRFKLLSEDRDIKLEGELHDVARQAAWDIKANVGYLALPLADMEQLFVLTGLKLASQGEFDDWVFTLDTGLESEALKTSQLIASGSGSTTSIEIGAAKLTSSGLDLDLTGKIDWSSQVALDLSGKIIQLDLSPWLKDWPDGESMAGDFELSSSESGLQIPLGNLVVTGTEQQLNFAGGIDLEANTITARLDWANLAWPLRGTSPDFASPSGGLTVQGTIDEWTASGQLQAQTGDYPKGHFEIAGGGDRTSSRISILDGDLLGGHASGVVSFDWKSELAWEATIDAQGIDPEPLAPGWPGRLDTEISVRSNGQPAAIQIDMTSLQGQLRGVPVNARGGISIEGKSVTFREMDVRTDEAVLLLDGDIAEAAGVSVRLNGRLPSVLLAGASGSIEAEGRISSHIDSGLLDFQLEAIGLAWDEYQVRELSLKANGAGPVPRFQLDATGVSALDLMLDEMSLSVSPAGESHELEVSATGEEFALSTAMTITPDDADKPFDGSWHGEFEKFNLGISQKYLFKLSDRAPIQWSQDNVSLGPLCVRENTDAKLCVTGDYQSAGNWSLIADVTALPLDYLRDISDLDVRFEQVIDGRLEWLQINGQAPTGGADFRVSAGRVLEIEDDDVVLESSEGKLAFTLQNGNLESGMFDIGFPGTGFIDVDFEILGIVDDRARALKGRTIAEIDDVGLIGQLALPGMDRISGRFSSDILLDGTLDDPSFSGGFKLTDGLIHYAPIGLRLENIEFDGQVVRRDKASFNGGFRAGEGIGSLGGQFIFEDLENMQLNLELSGEQLLLVNTDDLKIKTDTGLKIGLSPALLEITGHVRVPTASVTPANLILERVSDSEDLVIETGMAGSDSEVTDETKNMQVHGELTVEFGEDVFVRVPGIETSISGSVLYTWHGDPVPMGEGRYLLQGQVDMYGPRLQIDNGQISFPGVPANNPNLNIRAEREVFGNTQIRSAGVRVIGTLKRPELEAFTVPHTNEDRAWTLLVTGTDFDQSQGVRGFDVGTYIAPKLYVSYGISLFDDDNIISARYDLRKGFGVKVSSGQRETGLDISYTIDR